MTPRQFWKQSSDTTRSMVAEKAGTTYDNLKHISLYKGSCGSKLAMRLSKASGEKMGVMEILFRDE